MYCTHSSQNKVHQVRGLLIENKSFAMKKQLLQLVELYYDLIFSKLLGRLVFLHKHFFIVLLVGKGLVRKKGFVYLLIVLSQVT